MAEPFVERRAVERLGAKMPLTFSTERNPEVQHKAESRNISTMNLCFETEVDLAIDERLEIHLQTISGPLTVLANVVRKKERLVACRFVEMSPEDTIKLRNWLYPPFEP